MREAKGNRWLGVVLIERLVATDCVGCLWIEVISDCQNGQAVSRW